MADKRTHASPKCCDLTNYQPPVKKKRHKKDGVSKIKPGQNILDCSQIKEPKRNVVQYLYVDPVFIEHATCTTTRRARFRAGGVEIPMEDNFYDCISETELNENKALVSDPLQQRLHQITDVINQVQDPKEFKDLLKEMAYTSYVLYRSFRKAYGKTKKENEHKCEYCREKEQREKDRLNNPENRDPIEYKPSNFDGVGDDGKPKGNLCPICNEPLAENPEAMNQNNPDPESQITLPAGSKLMMGSTPLSYPGLNEQASQTQKPSPSKSPIKAEQSSQTIKPEGMLTNASPSKSCGCASSGPQQDPSKVLFLKPVSISIPLKLQVESEDMKPRFIETEIVLKSYFDPPPTQQSSSPQDVVSTSASQPEPYLSRSPSKVTSDIFYSCISSSGIIEPVREEHIPPKGAASLNEVFEIVNKRMQTPKNVPPPPPPLASLMVGNLPQSRLEMPKIDEDAKVKSIRDQLMKEVKDTLDSPVLKNVLKPIPDKGLMINEPSNVLKPIPDKSLKTTVPDTAPKLRPSNILERTEPEKTPKPLPINTLEKTVPEIAPKPKPKDNVPENVPKPEPAKTLVQPIPEIAPKPLPDKTLVVAKPEIAPKPLPDKTSERFVPEISPKPLSDNALVGPIPENDVKPFLKPTEDSKSIKSLATSSSLQMVMRKPKPISNQALQKRASWSHFTAPVPEPTGLISETIQTDVTAVHPTGHYKRNELRTEIQEDLQELLEPKPKMAENKYAPDERDEILLDLSKLFHPDIAPTLPKETNKEKALDDIRYLLEPPKPTLDAVASRVSILVNIRYILQPKLKKKPGKKIYSKAAREKILEDLHEVLTPKKLKNPNALKIRDSVLNDLRYMLDAGKQKAPKQRGQTDLSAQPSQSSQLRRTTTRRSSATTKIKKPNEVDNSVLADLMYLLDPNQVHPPQPAALLQPVAAPQPNATTQPVATTPATHHAIITPKQPPTQKPPVTYGGSSPDSSRQKDNKVDQAKLSPSSQVVDQTPQELMATTKAEGLSLASTLYSGISSDTFFARMQDTSPENYRPRSTLNDEDVPAKSDKGQEPRKSWLQELMGKKDSNLDKPSKDVRKTLPELPSKPKMISHATQSSNEHLTRHSADNMPKDSDGKRKLFRVSNDKSEAKSRRSTDGTQDSKARKQKDLSRIVEGSESLSSPINDSASESKSPIANKTKLNQTKPPGLEPRKSDESKMNLLSGSISSRERYSIPYVDPLVYHDRTRYSEQILEAEKRPSLSRYDKPSDDSFVKPKDKIHDSTRYSEQKLPNESQQSKSGIDKPNDYKFVKPQEKAPDRTRLSEQLPQTSRYSKPYDDSFVKPQDKIHDSTRYSDQKLPSESRLSRSGFDKPDDYKFVKPQEKAPDRTQPLEQQPQNESRLSTSRYSKQYDDSFVKPQDKIHDSTRYSDQKLPSESRLSRRGFDKPIDYSFAKPQDKIHDSTRYSDQKLPSESRLSRSGIDKPDNYKFVKPQEKAADRTQPLEKQQQNESRLSTSRYSKPYYDSFVKPQDKIHDSTRYSDQKLPSDSRLSRSGIEKPDDNKFVKPQEKALDRTRPSEHLPQNESRLSRSRYDKPIDDSFVKPQDKIHDSTQYSEQQLPNESRLSRSRYDKPVDYSFAKPLDKIHDSTQYSEQQLPNESRLSRSRNDKPDDYKFVKPQEKAIDRTRPLEQLPQNESRLSGSRHDKPFDDSFVKPQDKIHDSTRYSEQQLPNESRLSKSRYEKPIDDSFAKPLDKIHDSTRYSEQLPEKESRLSRSRYDKPITELFVRPQEKIHDRARHSEPLLQNENEMKSKSRYEKPIDDSFAKPHDKIHDSTRYSDQPFSSKTAKPIDDSFVKPQDKIREKPQYSQQPPLNESRLSSSKDVKQLPNRKRYSDLASKPNDFSFVKPKEKIHERPQYSEQLTQTESQQPTSENAEPIDESFVKPQEKIHDRKPFSDQVIEAASKPNEFPFVKPKEKIPERTRHSEQLPQNESRQSANRYEKPTDDFFVNPQEYLQDKTRYPDQVIAAERQSESSYGKPFDNSFKKQQEKNLDEPRNSKELPQNESRQSANRYEKPTDDFFVNPQEYLQDKTRYSDQVVAPKRQSDSSYGKPFDHSFKKPQEKNLDEPRNSKPPIQNEIQQSTNKNSKPFEDSFAKPQDKPRYSELPIDADSRPSNSIHSNASDVAKPHESFHSKTESRTSKSRNSKASDRPSINSNHNDVDARQSAQDTALTRQPIVSQDNLKRSSMQSLIVIRSPRSDKTPLKSQDDDRKEIALPKKDIGVLENIMANAIREDIDNWKNKEPKAKTPDHGTKSSKDDIKKPKSSDMDRKSDLQHNLSRMSDDKSKSKEPTAKTPDHGTKSSKDNIKKPRSSDMDRKSDLQHNLSRMSDDKSKTLPQKYSDVPKAFAKSRPPLSHQVAQYRDSVNDFQAFPENKTKPSQTEDTESIGDMPAKISNTSRLSATAKPRESYSERQPHLMADKTRISEVQIENRQPPAKRDSMQSYISVFSDLSVTQSKQIESPYKRKPDLSDDNIIKSRSPKELLDNQEKPISKSRPSSNKKLSSKPKAMNIIEQSTNDGNQNYPIMYPYTPLKSDTTVEPKHKPRKLFDQPESEIHLKPDFSLQFEPPKPVNASTPYRPEQLKALDLKSPKASYDQPQNLPATASTDSKLIIHYESKSSINRFAKPSLTSNRPRDSEYIIQTGIRQPSRNDSQQIIQTGSRHPSRNDSQIIIPTESRQNLPATASTDSKLIIHYESKSSINRFAKPSLTSNRPRDSDLIIQTGSRHPSRNDSQLYISTPHYQRQPVTATDDKKDHSNVGQPNLLKDIMIKSDIPKTFQEPVTSKKTPNENPSILLHPESIKKSEDVIPIKDRNRLSLPVPEHQREYGILDKKYSTPNIPTYEKDYQSYQPQGQVLQTEQDKNQPKLSKHTIEQQTSPTSSEESSSSSIPNRPEELKALDLKSPKASYDQPQNLPATASTDSKLIIHYESKASINRFAKPSLTSNRPRDSENIIQTGSRQPSRNDSQLIIQTGSRHLSRNDSQIIIPTESRQNLPATASTDSKLIIHYESKSSINRFGKPSLTSNRPKDSELIIQTGSRQPSRNDSQLIIQTGSRQPSRNDSQLIIQTESRHPSRNDSQIIIQTGSRHPSRNDSQIIIQTGNRHPSRNDSQIIIQTGSRHPSRNDSLLIIQTESRQNLPAIASTDSKLIIHYESRSSINRLDKPSITSNRPRDSKPIIQTGSRHPSRNDSQIYITTPHYQRQPVTATDDKKEHSNVGQPNLLKDIVIKPDIPKTFPEPVTTKKTPIENPSILLHPESIKTSEDVIPIKDRNRLSLPVPEHQREYGILDKKYSTPNIPTYEKDYQSYQPQMIKSDIPKTFPEPVTTKKTPIENPSILLHPESIKTSEDVIRIKDRNRLSLPVPEHQREYGILDKKYSTPNIPTYEKDYQSYQPQGKVLQTEQDKNQPKLSKHTIEQQTSPTSSEGQPNLLKDIMIKSGIPKTFPEPVTTKKTPNENPSILLHPESINKSEDVIPIKDRNRLSLPVPEHQREYGMLDKKYSTPNIPTYEKDYQSYQPQGQVLQTEHDKNQPKLSKHTIEQQTSPISSKESSSSSSSSNDPSTSEDIKPTEDDQKDVIKDKPLASPEVVDEKPLIYLYSRPTDNEENKENKQPLGNLLLNLKNSISSEFQFRPVVEATKPEDKTDIDKINNESPVEAPKPDDKTDIGQKEESPVISEPPAVKVAPPLKNNNNFTTAKAMVLKPRIQRKDSTTKAASPNMSIIDFHNRTANTTINPRPLTPIKDSNPPQLQDSISIMQKPSPVPVLMRNNEPEIPSTSPAQIEQIPKIQQIINSNIPEFNISQFSPEFKKKQSISSIVVSQSKPVISTTEDSQRPPETPVKERFNISTVKPEAIILSPSKPEPEPEEGGIIIISKGIKSTPKKPAPSQASSSSPKATTAATESKTLLEPPTNLGYVTSITIQAKTSAKPK